MFTGNSNSWLSRMNPWSKHEPVHSMPAMLSSTSIVPFEYIPPQLAAFSNRIPTEDGWCFERKFDGYRLQVVVQRGTARFFTRAGIDVSHKLQSLVPAIKSLNIRDAVLDGELCAHSNDDRSDLGLLNRTFHHNGPFRFYAFDVLSCNGVNLRNRPLADRKQVLSSLLIGAKTIDQIQNVPSWAGSGSELFGIMARQGHEGIVAKRTDAPYRAGQRSSDWLKIKVLQKDEFVIVGWQTDAAKSMITSLLLASRTESGLAYCGRVGTGWTLQGRRAMLGRLSQGEQANAIVHAPVRAQVYWSNGTQIALVQYADISAHGMLRHPSFIADL